MDLLPADVATKVVRLTTPRDACRLSLVSRYTRFIADSDAVWQEFLPPDVVFATARAVNPADVLFSRSKDLYHHLSDHPILIDGGKKVFYLEKRSGKKCYMIGARNLEINGSNSPGIYQWIHLPEARFAEVAELVRNWGLRIHGEISCKMLCPDTTYAAYLVFKTREGAAGFEEAASKASFGISGYHHHRTRMCNIRVRNNVSTRLRLLLSPEKREDGWWELKLGEHFNRKDEECVKLEMSLVMNDGASNEGLIFQGIDIRPKITPREMLQKA